MKKIIIVLVILVLLGGGYLYYQKHESEEKPVIIPTPQPAQTQATGTESATPTTGSAAYKDGSYTGDAVATDQGYGTVQIKAVIVNGKITDVQFVQYPNTPGHTLEVSQQAMPALIQEAITAQNADVTIISGATQTTQAFIQSLQSALNQAKS